MNNSFSACFFVSENRQSEDGIALGRWFGAIEINKLIKFMSVIRGNFFVWNWEACLKNSAYGLPFNGLLIGL